MFYNTLTYRILPTINNVSQTPNKKPRTIRYMNDFSAEHFTAPQYYEKFKKFSNKYKSKIKCLQVKNSRLEKKVAHLKLQLKTHLKGLRENL